MCKTQAVVMVIKSRIAKCSILNCNINLNTADTLIMTVINIISLPLTAHGSPGSFHRLVLTSTHFLRCPRGILPMCLSGLIHKVKVAVVLLLIIFVEKVIHF